MGYKGFVVLGEWRGLVVIAEDYHSKGRRIESRSFLFFSGTYLEQTRVKKCDGVRNRWSISREKKGVSGDEEE